jgi:hypothetical protein
MFGVYFFGERGRGGGGGGGGDGRVLIIHDLECTYCHTNVTTAYNKPRSNWELRYYGLLRSEWWSFLTDSSGQPSGPIFRGQEPIGHQGSGPLTRRISCTRNVGKELPLLAA